MGKNTSSLVYKIGKFGLPNAAAAADHLLDHARYLPNYLPRHVWNFFVRLVFKTLPFDARVKKALNLQPRSEDPDNPFPCRLLCNGGPDSAKHVLGACPMTLEIKDWLKLNAPRSPDEELQHSLLSFPSDGRRKEATKLVIALWAIWCISRKGLFSSAAEATKLILNRINATCDHLATSLDQKNSRRAAAAIRKKERAQESFQFVEEKLASLTSKDTIIFTDGSGKNNFSGAGCIVDCPYVTPDDDEVKCVSRLRAALGKGTNNLGELWAIGMALEFIKYLKDNNRWASGDVHLFSDSDYAIKGILGATKLRSNLELLAAVRKMYDLLVSMGINVFLHWVKGHAGIDHNEIADELAGLANIDSADGNCMSFLERIDLINTGNLIDYDRVDLTLQLDNG